MLAFIGGEPRPGPGVLSASACSTPSVTDPGKPYWIDFRVDYVVFGYVAAICALTAILFGLAPALHVSKTNNNEVLKEGGRGTTGNRRARWLSGTMVVTELALTVVLLAGAGLMIRSFMNLQTLDARVPDRQSRDDADAAARDEVHDRRRPAWRSTSRVEPRLAAIAGIESVALTTTVPPLEAGDTAVRDRRTAGAGARQAAAEASGPSGSARGFFEVARRAAAPRPRVQRHRRRARLRDGHHQRADGVAVLPGEDPIGRRLRFVQR